jgi:hypothetical protein
VETIGGIAVGSWQLGRKKIYEYYIMKSYFSFLIISIFLFWGCGKKVTQKVPAPLPTNFSFGHSDTLLPPEKIDTSKLEHVYRQYENFEKSPGTLTLNKDQTFVLEFYGFIHQSMLGTWFIKTDTLNCYISESYCFDSYIANLNKNTTWKFILINHNLYPAMDLGRPFLNKKLYDYNVQTNQKTFFIF